MRNATVITLLAIYVALSAGAREDLSINKPLSVTEVRPDRTSVSVGERVVLDFALEATYTNPFDSDQVRVDASVTPATGTPWLVPGFLYRPYTRCLDAEKERLDMQGPATWQVRLSFLAPGSYKVSVKAADRSGEVVSEPLIINVSAAPDGDDSRLMIRRDKNDCRYFVTASGRTYFPVGANVCWGGGRGTFDYDLWLPKYAAAGCDYTRLWLSPMWFTFGMNTPESGYDAIELRNAWRLDYVLEMAERLGIRLMLCVDSFNILRGKKTIYGQWEESPYRDSNGGPLSKPGEYFTNPQMKKAYKDRLRYLVARYGYSPNVMAWEFWNEVDIIDDFDPAPVTEWHQEMARFLRSIDPWQHLITTSTARPAGVPQLDALPELEFVQTHRYGSKDMAFELGQDRATKAAAQDRPHFHGEFGITHLGRSGEADPNGVYIHNALFSSVGQMQAGSPMTWWWDSYVEPRNLYPVYASFTGWIKGFDFVRQEAKPAEAAFERVRTDARIPEDDIFQPEAVSWEPAPFNQPRVVRISKKGELETDGQLAGLMHGIRNHPDCHNPVTFELSAPRKSRFGVAVNGVSGHGGAALDICIDGESVLKEDFADKDQSTDTLTQYNRIYWVDVPKGTHTVVVENTGADWFYVSYRISWLKPRPPLRALGVQGKSMGLLWVQNRAHTWTNANSPDYKPVPIKGARLVLRSWPAGVWRIEQWGTVEGRALQTDEIRVGTDGILRMNLPEITWDTAYRLVRKEE